MESKYPESWSRQTPKGYEPYGKIAKLEDNESVIFYGPFVEHGCAALTMFLEEVCDNCSTKPINDLLEIQTSFEE